MGGYGSGRWRWHRSRRNVSHCLTICAPTTGRRIDNLLSTSVGRFYWPEYRHYVIPYTVEPDGDDYVLDLLIPDSVTQRVRLKATTPNYGGRRWWFECLTCEGRVGRLYRIPFSGYFQCRTCLNLAYESSQIRGTWLHNLCRETAAGTPFRISDVLDYVREQNSGHRWQKMIAQTQPFKVGPEGLRQLKTKDVLPFSRAWIAAGGAPVELARVDLNC